MPDRSTSIRVAQPLSSGNVPRPLLSAGKSATCYGNIEAQVCTALVSDSDRAAIVISYSGLAPNLKEILPILGSRHVPVIVIGTPCCSAFTPTLPPTLR